ncbi:MAG: hypothetical protein JJT96_09840 [Opitutales bacterium]|nr:hypothetical protein [Opitutales bacterium]
MCLKTILRLAALAGAATAVILQSGCTASSQTQPPRTAIEQLLLSTAVDNALKGVQLPEVAGERVYVDSSMLEAYDRGYVVGSIRALLSENGALLQGSRDNATMIVEARSGGLGIDVSDSLLGIPSIPIIIPGAGTSEFPELVLYASNKQASVSKIGLLGYYVDGTNAFSTEPLVGTSYFNQYRFLLLLQINFTDIPERRRF